MGSLQYLTITLPDIAYAVNKACQFMQPSTDERWSAVKRILWYLKHTVDHGVFTTHNSTKKATVCQIGVESDEWRNKQ